MWSTQPLIWAWVDQSFKNNAERVLLLSRFELATVDYIEEKLIFLKKKIRRLINFLLESIQFSLITLAVLKNCIIIVVVNLGFTTLLTSQVISVASYNEREKSDKFCSEALISAWGSFTCRKSMTRDPRLYFHSEGSHTQDFYALKNPSTPVGFEPANLGTSGVYDNHGVS